MTQRDIGGYGLNGCLGRYVGEHGALLVRLSSAALDDQGREVQIWDYQYDEKATPCVVERFEDGIQIRMEELSALRGSRSYVSNATRWKDLRLFMRSGRLSSAESAIRTPSPDFGRMTYFDAILVLSRRPVPAERNAGIPGFWVEIPLVEKLRDYDRPLSGEGDSRELCDRVIAGGGPAFHLVGALQSGGAKGLFLGQDPSPRTS